MRGFVIEDFVNALTNPFLLMGAVVTAALTVVGLLGGFGCGLVIALLRSAPQPAVRRVAQGYIRFFRGTPLLIQMVMIYSGLPQLGIKFGVLTSVIVALVLNEAAYMAEIIRGGRPLPRDDDPVGPGPTLPRAPFRPRRAGEGNDDDGSREDDARGGSGRPAALGCRSMSDIKRYILEDFPRSVSPSSHATEANGFVFLTGQFGRDLDDPDKPLPRGIRAQTDQTLRNMRRALEALGLTMGDVMSVRVFLTGFKRDYDAMNEVYAAFFPEDARPARTCVGVTDLVRDALVEIDCIARR